LFGLLTVIKQKIVGLPQSKPASGRVNKNFSSSALSRQYTCTCRPRGRFYREELAVLNIGSLIFCSD